MNLTILGSTGSVGHQALSVALENGIKIDALCAGSDADALEAQVRATGARFAALANEEAAMKLKSALADTPCRVFALEEGILEMIAQSPSSLFLNSIVGAAGLKPSLAVIEKGTELALANKETLVCAGETVMARAKEKGVRIIPVDSEHSAIYQCLKANGGRSLRRILLTASGGPFFGKTREELLSVRACDALAHPTWNMGKRITIDSATMMNKGFEIIEATHLFGVGEDKIEVVVQRGSIIHSMVEFSDGCTLAQLGTPDMCAPIRFALTEHAGYEMKGKVTPLDFRNMNFIPIGKPDEETFSLLSLAREVSRLGGTYGAAMNAADEAAVALFLDGKIGFLDIFDIVRSETLGYNHGSDPIEAGRESFSRVMRSFS